MQVLTSASHVLLPVVLSVKRIGVNEYVCSSESVFHIFTLRVVSAGYPTHKEKVKKRPGGRAEGT